MRRELIKVLVLKIKLLEFEAIRDEFIGREFAHKDYFDVVFDKIVDQSAAFRNLSTFLNHYARIPPSLRFN